MAIHFSKDRMAEVKDNYRRWWNGDLDRPIMNLTLHGAHPHPTGGKSYAPWLSQANCGEFRWSPEELIDTMDDGLSTLEFAGDGYPRVSFDCFGPGVVAAFCGARLDNSSGRVWFFPEKEQEINEIHAVYDPHNPWAERIKAIYRAGMERWDGLVVMGMPDLGGVMDVAATLRGTENLLMDLYDEPEEVLRLIGEIETAWYAAYDDFSKILHPAGGDMGWTDWSGILSPDPAYIAQCDFCYMIGDEMFKEFVLPSLKRDTERLTNVIYHLDGIGELCHLDTILSLPDLKAVQWVYGEGKPGPMHWLDVYRKIRAGGKRMWLVGGIQDFFDVSDAIGAEGFYCSFGLNAQDQDLKKKLLKRR